MNENYAIINGTRVELTDEQVKALGVETRKNPFEKVKEYYVYYRVTEYGDAEDYIESGDYTDQHLYENVNYFNDKTFANQVALHQLLYRKLLKFAYDNECEDNQTWNKTNWHYYIDYNTEEGRFYAGAAGTFKHHDVWFCFKESTERAIKEVVEPFMKEHPDFVW